MTDEKPKWRNPNIPTTVIQNMLAHSKSEKTWWTAAEKQTRKDLERAQRRIQATEAEIAEFEEELLYRREHPEGA